MANLKLAWHFDFHSHKTVRIGHAPDFKGIAAELKRHGVEEIISFAKCHTGFSYYPTRFGTPHPRMKGDVFGGIVKACRAKKIRIMAYVSFGIDGEAGRRHSDWARVGKDGPHITPDHFVSVCPFTGYTAELMLPQIDEIIRKYKPDGFFFDTMGALGVCYCAACRRDFRAHSGLDIPRESEDMGWSEYGHFRHKRGMALLKKIGDFIQARRPGAAIGFNHVGTPDHPEKMPRSLTRLTLDPNTRAPQSREMSFFAAYGAYADRPADIMPTIFNQGWGDWSLAHPVRLQQTAATVWARGARLYMGDRLRPEGRLDGATIQALEIISTARNRAEAEFPPDNALPADDALILHSQSLVYGRDLSSYDVNSAELMKPLKSAYHLVTDAGLSAGVTAEFFLHRHIRNAGLVILPELPSIEAATEKALKKFVMNGGVLLAVGNIPLVKDKPLEWLGVIRNPKPAQDHVWLPSLNSGLPVLVRGNFHPLRLKGARTIMAAIPPYDLQHGIRFGWGIGPAAAGKGALPALTCRRIGKGAAWYLEAPLFSDYSGGANWQQVEWFRRLAGMILPAPRARITGSPGNVEMIVRRRAAETWIILLNHGAAETTGASWPRVLPPLPAYPLTVEARADTLPAAVTCAGREINRYSYSAGVLRVPLVMDEPWKTIHFKWKEQQPC